ncbi:DUF4399 domain-containing protein [Pseudohongiella spirulinae]|uniref:Uncharacterized conserved secreted protein n=1 Tax=Pseudohongiella spirulinae TaxID=1249552 RepID=A0A0S2K9V4_9GAMM|nr:DUF4399 domain-containing protein [Pseudohongiella spirulinae]ALO45131.1 Uncharacterized conserved secreted protein [Pseudohongiella spirulinae]
MKKNLSILSGLILAAGLSATLLAQPSTAPEGASVYIVSPQNGDTVSTTFTVVFGLSGMGVAPAGIAMPNTGHHHLLINMDTLPDLGQPLGADVMHFGLGQTETTVTLEPGQHTLQLVLGDHMHVPHNPPVMSEKITITVE